MLHSFRFKTVPVLGYVSYQQSDFVLVVTWYNFSTIAGLYATIPPHPSPPHVTLLNLSLESLFDFSLQMMSYF